MSNNNNPSYLVEGTAWVLSEKDNKKYPIKISQPFKTKEEAGNYAKELAEYYKGIRFNVSHSSDIKGLTDTHYEYSQYWKEAVEFTHND